MEVASASSSGQHGAQSAERAQNIGDYIGDSYRSSSKGGYREFRQKGPAISNAVPHSKDALVSYRD